MAVVIAVAGLLIALAKIDHLALLKSLFSTVMVTLCVADECLRRDSADARIIKLAIEQGWLSCVDNPVLQESLSRSLGAGEQSSLLYALESKETCLLILDDALARKHAIRKQLNVVGTAGVLFAAQRKDLIVDAEVLVAQLNPMGYRISPAVIMQLKGG